MDCIEYNGKPYPQVKRGGVVYRMHRLIGCLAHNMRYDDERLMRHTCDNPCCIRVEHLVPGTQADNMHDAVERGRTIRGDAHPRAHLNERQLQAIAADTRSCRAIAEDYGVGFGTVARIKRNEQRMSRR